MTSIIDELTAAAIAHGLDKSAASWSVTGGEVFNVPLRTIEDGLLEAMATTGDMHLEGGNFGKPPRRLLHA